MQSLRLLLQPGQPGAGVSFLNGPLCRLGSFRAASIGRTGGSLAFDNEVGAGHWRASRVLRTYYGACVPVTKVLSYVRPALRDRVRSCSYGPAVEFAVEI